MGDHERRQTHHVFFLHKGVKFHDGVAFTCADAQYSMDELAEPYGLPVGAFQRYRQLGADIKQREAEAKYLLAEAGYAKGLEVKLMLRRGPLYKRGALSRQDDLKKSASTSSSPSSTPPPLTIAGGRATSRHTQHRRLSIWMSPICTTRVSPAMLRPITENTAIPSATTFSRSRVACSMSRNERKLPGRWNVSCSKTSPTIAAITGNRPWATGIGCRIGPHFWA